MIYTERKKLKKKGGGKFVNLGEEFNRYAITPFLYTKIIIKAIMQLHF
jgi:hypothetical protein